MSERFTREQPRTAPISATPVLVEIEAEYIPLLFSALEKYHNPYYWKTDEDYQLGYSGIVRLEKALLTDMSQSIVFELQRLYRLIDTSFNGREYTATGAFVNGYPVIAPGLPDVPPVSTDAPNAMRAHLGRLQQLGENAATGAAYPAGAGVQNSSPLPASGSWAARLLALQGETGGLFGFGGTPTTLADLLQAGRVNTPADQGAISDTFEEILNTLASGGSITTALGNLLARGVNVASDGGVMLLQAATLAATLAGAGAGAGANIRIVAELARLNKFLTGADAAIPEPPLPATGVLYPGLYDAAGELYIPQILSQLQGDVGNLANYLTGASDNTLGVVERGEEISGRLFDPAQNLNITQWLKADVAANQAIAAYLRQEGLDPTTQQNLLQNILDALQAGAGPGGGGTFTLDATQYAAFTALLNCICEGVNGTPEEPGLNPEPTMDCGGIPVAWLRVSNWIDLGPVPDATLPDLRAYAAEFTFPAGYGIEATVNQEGRPVYRLAGNQPWYEWCEGWDFSGGLVPFSATAFNGTQSFAAQIADQGTINTVPEVGGRTNSATTTLPAGGGPRYIGFTWYTTTGSPPSRNFWIKSYVTEA